MTKPYYRCISDPYNEYIGYEMIEYDFHRLLKEGSLPPGSVWKESETKIKFKVAGNEKYYSYAVVLDEVPRNIRREPQRLER